MQCKNQLLVEMLYTNGKSCFSPEKGYKMTVYSTVLSLQDVIETPPMLRDVIGTSISSWCSSVRENRELFEVRDAYKERELQFSYEMVKGELNRKVFQKTPQYIYK